MNKNFCVLPLLLPLLNGCAVPVAEDVTGYYPPVSVLPIAEPVAPYCGYPLDRLGEGSLVASRTRITPSDQNGVLDSTELSSSVSGEIRVVEVIRAVSCDNRRILSVSGSQAKVEWDGRTEDGDWAEPGTYFAIAKNASDRISGFLRITVGASDSQCAVATNLQQLLNTRVSFGGMEMLADEVLDVPEPGWLCLSVERLGETRTAPVVGLDDGLLFSPFAFTASTREVSMAVPVQGRSRLQLGGRNGAFLVRASFVADPDVEATNHDSGADDLPDTLTCRGRLVSRPHPFDLNSRPHWRGLDEARFPEGRRPVAREGVHVRCVVQFHIYGVPDAQPLIRRGETGYGADIARYSAAFSIEKMRAIDSKSTSMVWRREDGGLESQFRPVFPLLDQIPGYPRIPDDFGFDPGGIIPDNPFPVPPPPPEKFITYFADGVTDATGAYNISVTLDDRAQGKPYRYKYAKCINWRSDCMGNVRTTDEIDDDSPNDIWDVTDYRRGEISARLITNAGSTPPDGGQIRRPVLEDSLVLANSIELGQATIPSDGVLLPREMNDLPVVIHEPFDPLDEDDEDYLIWLLGGQPIDTGDGQSFCQTPRHKLCYGWDRQCDWHPQCSSSSYPVSCRAENVLKMLLDAGYDVWVVDHGYGSSIEEVAPRAPTLWQEVTEYPFEEEGRVIAVGGLSSGGVVARVALKMAERKTALEALNEQFGTDFQLFNRESLDAVPDRVAAYLSFDSPHLGATVPVALQAYLHDDELATASTLPSLLTSQAAKELLSNLVDDGIDTPCFEEEGFLGFIGKTEVPKSCTLQRSTPELESQIANSPSVAGQFLRRSVIDPDRISSDGVDQLVRDTIEVLGDSDANTGWQVVFPDGLPATVPSFGITNARRYGDGILHTNSEVLNVEIEMPNSTRRQRLLDFPQQRPGSTYPGICKAMTLGGPQGGRTGAIPGLLEDCYDRAGIPVVCDVGGIVAGLIRSGLAGLGLVESGDFDQVKVTPLVPMQFPTFISAESALIAPGGESSRGAYAFGWNDVLWADRDRLHFDITDEACRFVRYHLDGTMKGDRDGVPTCRSNMLRRCADGGMGPGQALAPGDAYTTDPSNFCDCDDAEFGKQACRVIIDEPKLSSGIRD